MVSRRDSSACLGLLCLVLAMAVAAPVRAAATFERTLANGFDIVVQSAPARRVGDRIALRLVVDVGAADEQRGQRGWAHLVEHLAFLGAGRFSRADIDALYDQPLLRHGRDFNAYTAAHHTVYTASVPRNRPDVLRDTLALMAAWLSDLHAAPDAVARESRVVQAELLSAASHRQRKADAAWSALLDGGTAPSPDRVHPTLDPADPTALRRFWATHYRASRAALVVAGDVDGEQVLRLATDAFDGLASGGAARPNPVSLHHDATGAPPAVLIQRNPALDEPQLVLGLLNRGTGVASAAEVIAVESLVHWWHQTATVQRRCGPVLREWLPLAHGGTGAFFVANVGPGRLPGCLDALETALARELAALDGPRWAVLADALHAALRGAHWYAAPSSSAHLADTTVRYRLSGLPASAVGGLGEAVLTQLARLGPADGRALIRATLANASWVAAFETGSETATLPAVPVLRAALDRIAAAEPTRVGAVASPRSSTPSGRDRSPPRERPVARLVDEAVSVNGARVLHLASGVQVHHVPSVHPDDPVSVMVINRNSLLHAGPSLASSARALPDLFELMQRDTDTGDGPLRRAHAAGVRASVFVEPTRQGMVLELPGAGLDAAFAVIGDWFRVGAVPADAGAVQSGRLQHRWSSVRSDNTRRLRDLLNASLYAVPPLDTHAVPTRDVLRAAHTVFFANAVETDVIVVGAVPAPLLRHLARQHLGGLVLRRTDGAVRLEPKPANRLIRVSTGAELADISVHFLQNKDNGVDTDAAHLIALRTALERQLWYRLREQDGLVYQLSVQLLRRAYARGGASVVVRTQADPVDVDRVLRALDQTVSALQSAPVNPAPWSRLRARWLADRDERLSSNLGVMHEFALLREHGLPYAAVSRVSDTLGRIDASALADFSRRYFNDAGRVALIMGPRADRAARRVPPDLSRRPD
ncbi:MAG: insulinase family protein [Pseudomonadota bacterium]